MKPTMLCRIFDWLLALTAVFVVLKVGLAALGALLLGLSGGVLGATVAGVLGLVVTYVLYHWMDDLVDRAVAGAPVE